ncbi:MULTISPECIES: ABC transporter transmembrane domain-containing protein [unclassified Marinobacter]|uniref:ABC transporter transmembrane domain-containing protein n=1 Tax=unclassified Marinobacter TaxID=83889 RepID=UPI00200C5ECE|nr:MULTISPECIES: ABC transporter transmembrane domain-containing protein [unclassified Marinobacter]UQG56105.1 ATP-binding cassette domain-containing protein [Marinobacter sp. M4C]UQG64909.1 ATP-binding cassette domain-containing protein [Marinobacter sp. M2C]UQG69188.1 ATP-binding cassette domain-containing protein [Marinobacter sp. M1C]
MKLVVGFIHPYRKAVAGAIVALVITAGITLGLGQGLRILVDQGLATESPANLARAVGLFFVLVLGLAAGSFARFYLVSWIGERVVADIRKRVFNHLIDLNPGFFESNRALEIQSRFTADTTVLQSVIGSTVSIALRNALMLIGGLLLLFITNAKLASVIVLGFPLVIVPIVIFGRRVRQLSRLSQDRVADVGSYVGENLTQIKTLQAFNHQPHDRRHFSEVSESAFDIAHDRIRQRAWLTTMAITLVMGAVGVVIWIGGLDVIYGRITPGELAAFVFYSLLVGVAAGAISEVIGELQRAAGSAARLFELLQTKSEFQRPADLPEQFPQPVKGGIRLEHLTFSYPGRIAQPALQDVCLEVRAGETLAIVGPSGAGKSTLFDLLLHFYQPSSGCVRIDGTDTRDVSLQALRSCFALVPQNPALFHGTVADNIRYARPQATQADVEEAAGIAHAHEFIVALPDGYQTRLGDGGLGLSGGQKQRLAIARALLADAPILLLDEATSALDAHSENLVQQAMPALTTGRTTLVIAHRLATVRDADRIAVFDQGRLLAVGSHQQLMQENGLYQRLAQLQFRNQTGE